MKIEKRDHDNFKFLKADKYHWNLKNLEKYIFINLLLDKPL